MPRPFHVAVLVDDLDEARHFYGEILGCSEGRSDTDWVDFDLFGHQFVCHRGTREAMTRSGQTEDNSVDGKEVPVPHYGVVLQMEEWEELASRLAAARVSFVIEPHVRFQGRPGEQGTMFIADPSGNALEFKGFRDLDQLFVAQ